MHRRVLCVMAVLSSSTAWSTLDQATVQNIADVRLSNNYVAYQVSGGVESAPGVVSALSYVEVASLGGGTVAQDAVSTFCKQNGCSYPRFGEGNEYLGVLSQGAVYRSKIHNAVYDTPTKVNGTDGAVAFRIVGDTVLFNLPVSEKAPSLFREIDEDVIIDVIQENDIVHRFKLCSTDAASATHCHDIKESVGAIGWYLSCWQYEAQFEAAGTLVAMTTTENTYTNDWTTFRAQVYDTVSKEVTAMSEKISFQSYFSPSARQVAFVEVDEGDYVWAQDWHICVTDIDTKAKVCSKNVNGTYDQMPTIVGWLDAATIIYLEQRGTSVQLYAMNYPSMAYTPITFTGLPSCTVPGCGVIGGGFRTPAIPALRGSTLAFSFETMLHAPEAYVCAMSTRTSFSCKAYSAVNAKIAPQEWKHAVISYTNEVDGGSVEALSLGNPESAKLVVFTHCGPAMAVLQTFLGFGTVCAAFPVATLVEQGYHVIMPNYRGSTGYGSMMRNSDKADWGGADYNDVLQAFVTFGKNKVLGHVGWSYGGYMSSLVLTRAKATHGIDIKAVVGGGCLTDLISHSGTTDIYKLLKSVYNGYYFDSPEIKAKWMEHSAIYHVENATAPTLMFHGVDDPRMPLSQAFQLHQALKNKKDMTTRFIVFPGSGHIPSDPNQRLKIWNETLTWFGSHMH